MSGIKHIVANVDGSRHDAGILRLSAALANRFGAILEAVFANVPPFIPVSTDGFIAPQMIEALESQLRERAAAGKTALAKLQLTHGKPIWTERAGSVADVVISQGRYADLTLLAQHAPEENDVPTEYDSPAEIVMALGRP